MVNKPGQLASGRQILPYTLFVLALCGLYVSSRSSYLLFHSLTEAFSAIILLTIFVLAWNSRTILDNHYLLFVGISFLASGALELAHMFAYKGLGVFPGRDANLPTQLWIASRALFALSLLIAPFFLHRRLDATVALWSFTGLTALLLAAVFTGVFPDCFIEGQGLTAFKLSSENLIVLILLATLGLLISNRDHFDPRVLRLLALAIVSGAAADLAFTQYVTVYDQANVIGHFLLLLSTVFLYRTFVVTTFKEPMAILCRNLEQSEARLRLIAQTSMDLIVQLDLTGKVVFCSPAVEQYGYTVATVIGQEFSTYIAPEDRNRARLAFRQAIGGKQIQTLILHLLRPDGGLAEVEISLGPLIVNGTTFGLQGISRDLTSRRQAERTLRQQAALLDQTADAIVATGLPPRITSWNSAAERIYGWTAAEALGQDLDLLLRTEFIGLSQEEVKAKLLARGRVATEVIHRDRQGRRLRVHVNLSLIRDNSDQAMGSLGVFRDLTARWEAEEALRASEERLQTVLKASSMGIFEINLLTGEGWWNEVEYQLLGLRPGEIACTLENFFHYVHGDDVLSLRVAWQQALQAGELNAEFRIVTADGRERWLAGKGQFLAEGRDPGQAPRFLGVNFDITDRKLAEEKLRLSEALYRGIGESIDYGVWVCAADGRNIYTSDSFLRMVGLSQEQCSDFGWGAVLHPDEAEHTLAAWRDCVRTGGTWDIEHRFRGIDGQWHPVLARGVPVRNPRGEITCWAGINLDISRIKEAKEQLKVSLAEKEVMLREIHHRVKNNLQVISSLISLQAEAADDEQVHRVFGDIRDRVRAMALVHEKLYQTGNLAQLNFADYAASLLQHLWRCHGTLAERARLHLAIAPLTLPIETAVPCGLILNELAGNALKHAFSDGRSGSVTVTLNLDPDTKDYCLQVADNGLGLPPGLDWRHARSLGLRLVQMLTGQLGGTVTVQGDRGLAFQVRFSLPEEQA